MEVMNIRNVNLLNVQLNLISGNLLPMTADDTSFSIFWKIYSFFIWLLEITQICILIPGCASVPKEKALKDGMIGVVVTIEVFFLVVQIHARKKLLHQLIREMNDVLRMDDEVMRNITMDTIKSIEMPLKFYWTAGVTSIMIWTCIPFTLVFQRNSFFYTDYRMPVVFSKEPFSTSIFVLGSFIVMISSIYIFMKKVSVDSYMINLILLMKAQYKYIALKLSVIFHDESPTINRDSSNGKKHYSETMKNYAEKQIKSLCRHHKAVIRISLMLKKLLSLNFSLIYIISVFRFCCIAVMVISIPSSTWVEILVFVMYATGGVVQLYILCSCVQQLLDASIEITDQAFHKRWYQFGSYMKQIFIFMIMSNNLEFKLSTFEKYNLSLPSFMVILNQSYSIALLLLRVN